MEINIETSHVRPSDQLREFIEGRILKLEHVFKGALRATVFLKTENAHKLNNKTVEIRIHAAGKDIFATSKSGKFEAAFMKSVTALKNQIRKIKR